MIAEVELRPLSKDTKQDYFNFFDAGAFPDNPYWRGCYCHFYSSPGDQWDPNAPANRDGREADIDSGVASGVLAYRDGKVIGWVNAGPRENFRNLRNYAAASDGTQNVGAIMCFVVTPDQRGLGVGSALLAGACDLLTELGMDFAEGYPTADPPKGRLPWTAHNYHGARSMYDKAGFDEVRKLDYFYVMRRNLQDPA